MNRSGILQALQDGDITLEEARRMLARPPQTEVATSASLVPSAAPAFAGSLQALLIDSLAAALYMEPQDIDPDVPFTELGLDSIIGVEWVSELNRRLGVRITATKVYDYPTLAEFSAYLQPLLSADRVAAITPVPAEPHESVTAAQLPQRRNDDHGIAIIGNAGRYPGAANLAEFWDNLANGRDSIVEIPAQRWNWADYYDQDRKKPGRIYCKWLGALTDIDQFDPAFFMISPAEAETMDPQYRIFLEQAYLAFEDAGYSPQSLSQQKCGVYMGVMNSEYVHLLSASQSSALNTGNSFSMAAARISYFLNLKGPAIPVDTACSSSLVSTHLACQALRNNEIDMALVGGVTLYLTPASYIGMCSAGMLSPEGQCKSFDDRANGFVPGEGAGAVVLKRLPDARRDGDHVLGVIIASGINQDGRTNGITAPSAQAQAELERDVYRRFNIDPASIDYVEAHGTGTRLGDPIELEALNTVFREHTDRRHFCALGAVKSNIGHTSAASGMAGIHKVLLSMGHQQLPPTLHVQKANEHCEFEDSPFYLNTTLIPWRPDPARPRRAAVSSFGFSGTNAHVVLEEFLEIPAEVQPMLPVMLVLSARTDEQLRQVVSQLLDYVVGLESCNQADLAAIAYTLQVGRDGLEVRLAATVSDREQLCRLLQGYLNGGTVTGMHCGRVKRRKGKLDFFSAGSGDADVLARLIQTARAGQMPERESCEQLLSLWVNGLSFDWQQLYHGQRPIRRQLPGYPFSRESYWVQSADAGKTASAVAIPAAAEPVGSTAAPAPVSLAKPRLSLNTPAGHAPAAGRSLSKPLTRLQAPVAVPLSEHESEPSLELSAGVATLRLDGVITGPQLSAVLARMNAMPEVRVLLLRLTPAAEIKLSADELQAGLQNCPLPVMAVLPRSAAEGFKPVTAACDLTILCDDQPFTNDVPEPAMASARAIARAPRLALEVLKQHWRNPVLSAAEQQRLASLRAEIYRHCQATVAADQRTMPQGQAIALRSQVVQLTSHDDGVAVLTMCERSRQNGFTPALNEGLIEAFAWVQQQQHLKVVVLTGYDQYFATGGTLEALQAIQQGQAQFTDAGVIDLPLRCDIPVIAAMQGHAIGAGWAMGMCCDLAVYSRESVYHSPYLSYGFTPGAGSTLMLPARLGRQLGQEVLWTAREYKGSTLEQRNISDPVVWRNEVLPLALQLAAQLARQSRRTLIEQKADATSVLRDRLAGIYDAELAMHARTFVDNTEVARRIEQQFHHAPVVVTEAPLPSASASDDAHQSLATVVDIMRDSLAAELHMPLSQISNDVAFVEMGMDSINSVTWVRALNQRFNIDIEAAEVYNHPTIDDFARFILAQNPVLGSVAPGSAMPGSDALETQSPSLETSVDSHATVSVTLPEIVQPKVLEPLRPKAPQRTVESSDIAVIGMSGQFPKARNVQQYWDNLINGRDCISEIPADRWSLAAYYDEQPETEGKSYSKWMGALEDVACFDPLFFNISPLEAEAMDPQQRLFLMACWHCLEDAGYNPAAMSGQSCGVFVGCGSGDYGMGEQRGELDVSAFTGNSMSILAARIAYLINLKGPCISLDTACSSSMVAIATACDNLTLGNCDTALAGGVSVLAGPVLHILTSQAGMLSPAGRCFTFDQRANGFVPGEGVGVLMLKRLDQAVADGDSVYGVIRGWGVNQDGKTNGITAPSGEAQQQLEQQVYQRFGVNPDSIQYVETHGTGTRLGDPIEIGGLKASFRRFTHREHYCALGSVKSNIGHLLAASGVASVIKVLLSFQHRQLAPSIHFKTLNEHIDLTQSPFYINTEARDWPVEDGKPRRAAVSSFGFSGTNAHMVLEEYPLVQTANHSGPVLIVLSARNSRQLQEVVSLLHDAVVARMNAGGLDLTALAYTLQTGRQAMAERLAFGAESATGLQATLRSIMDTGVDTAGEHIVRSRAARQLERNMTADVAEALARWRNSSTDHSVLSLWAQGYEVDWAQLYGDHPPGKISLPGYPFARERYWKQSYQLDDHRPQVQLYRPVWRPEAAALQTAADETTRHVIVTAGLPAATTADIAAAFPAAQCRSFSLPADGSEPFAVWAEQLLEVFQAALAAPQRSGMLIQMLLPEGQSAAGFAAMMKTLQLEYPAVCGQVIEVADHASAVALSEENRYHRQSGHISYRQGQRCVPDWQLINAVDSAGDCRWKEQGVYLITGGMGALGLIFAREAVARTSRCTLILTGRSALTPVQQRQCDELTRSGAVVIYKILDVTDRPAVFDLIAGITRDHGGLDGILHAAGVHQDGFIRDKSAQSLRQVLAAKVAGTINLDEASRDLPLAFFVMFSSIAAVTGNVGQVDYAAANGFMDAYASRRNDWRQHGRRQGKSLSINWSLWQDGGMQIDAETLATLQDSGVEAIGMKDGLAAFYQALEVDSTQVMVTASQTLKTTDHSRSEPVSTVEIAAAEPAMIPAIDRPVDMQTVQSRTVQQLKTLLGDALKLSPARIDADAPLENYGIDSLLITRLNRALTKVFSGLPKTLWFEVQSLNELAAYLLQHCQAECLEWTATETVVAPYQSPQPSRPAINGAVKSSPVITATADTSLEPIAIIGLTGRYPQADTLDQFWQNLRDGRDCISEIPAERWSLEGFFHPTPAVAIANGQSYCKWGGFVNGFAEFDARFFNLSAPAVLAMDPQERLFVQSCWELLETAGYTREALSSRFDSRVGVFAGITKTGFEHYRRHWQTEGVVPYTSFGSVANRVSYLLNLKGPSMPVDTMCSSSLTAIHEACEHLRRGSCRMAIAGGVNLYLHPSSYVNLSAQHMLSKTGRCRSFGADADGFVPGEGVGTVLLKPLSQAQRDGDLIHALIRASGINHGGKTNGFTVPNPNAQAELIRETLSVAGIDPRTVSYIEAHGTGTELGDPVEVRGLVQGFGLDRDADTGFCALGSVKSNMGHLEAAAGIAGLTKIVLQMQHGQIVPSLHAQSLNQNIDFAVTPFKVSQALTDWPRPVLSRDGETREYPRIAGLSSFGAGGSNAHVIVEEYVPATVATANAPRHQTVAFVLSARNEQRLLAYVQQFERFLQTASPDLTALACTLQTGREAMEYRIGCVVDSVAQLQQRLAAFSNDPGAAEGWHRTRTRSDDDINLFAEDEELQQVLVSWLAKGRLDRVLGIWVKGGTIPWQLLYGNQPPVKVVLPTYPFARDRYWVDTHGYRGESSDRQQTQPLSPLLHENISSLSGLCFRTRVSGEEFFVADHRVQGEKVFPGVAYLEMACAAAARLTAADGGVTLENIAWVQPLVITDPVDLRISLQDLADQRLDFMIQSSAQLTHCQGRVSASTPATTDTLDLASLQANINTHVLDGRQCYDLLATTGIDYGPRMQAITRLQSGHGQVLARLSVPAGADTAGFILQPSLLDAALQAAFGMSLGSTQTTTTTWVPFAVTRIEVMSGCPSLAWVWIRTAGEDGQIRKLDMDLCDDRGVVQVRIRGFSFRALKQAPGLETLLLQPEWQAQPIQAGQSNTMAQHWVLACQFDMDTFAELSTRTGTDRCKALISTAATIDQQYADICRQAMHWLQTVLSQPKLAKTLVQVLVPAQAHGALLAGLAGLFKTAQLENPALHGQVISVDASQSAARWHAVIQQNRQMPADQRVAYIDGERHVQRWQPLAMYPGADTTLSGCLKAAGVYLITGGAGGLGLIFARAIAQAVPENERHQTTIILAGRSALSSRQQAQLTEITGVRLQYRQVDIGVTQQVEGLIADVESQFGPLTGVLHSAGVIRDQLLVHKTDAMVAEVLAPKVAGTVCLDRATQHCPLDFFVLFAAGAGVLGNPGQADYAAANGFMDEYAHYRNQQVSRGHGRGRTLAIDWPLWQQGGMTVDAATEQRMQDAIGMAAMPAAAGIAALSRALQSAQAQVWVLYGDVERMHTRLLNPVTVDPDALVSDVEGPAVQMTSEAGLALLTEMLADALKVPLSSLYADQPLAELGIDSIIAINLTTELEKIVGPLSKTLFFEYDTVGDLAQALQQDYAQPLQQWQQAHTGEAVSETTAVEPEFQDHSFFPVDELRQQVYDYLCDLLVVSLKLPREAVYPSQPMSEFGIDSIIAMNMTSQMEQRFGSLSKTLFFEYESPADLADYLLEQFPQAFVTPTATRSTKTTTNQAAIRTGNWHVSSVDTHSNASMDTHLNASVNASVDTHLNRSMDNTSVDTHPNSLVDTHSNASVDTHSNASMDTHLNASVDTHLNASMDTDPNASVDTHSNASVDTHLNTSMDTHLNRSVDTHRNYRKAGRDGDVEPLNIAVVGLSGRYPMAEDLESFWRNLKQGRDCISEVPAERWDWRDYYAGPEQPFLGHHSKWGGFLQDVDQFDPQFFGIAPRAAAYIDPQERLILEQSWNALEDAGYRREDLRSEDAATAAVGVYVGVIYAEYQLFGVEATLKGQRSAFATSLGSIANRVSYTLNLNGPSMVVDTLCSGAMTCIHLACQDLIMGRTRMALAGGVNLTLHPSKYQVLSTGRFISTEGRCESFGEGGDGYIPSEGAGMALLKPLADAERDGDHIYGVIQGSAINHGGRTSGFSVPSPNAQQQVIRQAMAQARVKPEHVSYIEAHGTGTKLGDPIEVSGLSKAFALQPGQAHCWLGSVKSNIGHCESAAGIASLTKVLLQMKHGQIVPSLHSDVLNPHIDFATTPFEVNQQLRDWQPVTENGQPLPRVAGISSFGAGGANAHLVVAEYREPVAVSMPVKGVPIVLSARYDTSLQAQIEHLYRFIESSAENSFAWLCRVAWTLQAGREAMEERLALTVDSVEQLKHLLKACLNGEFDEGVFYRGTVADPQVTASAQARVWVPAEQSVLLQHWVQGGKIDWLSVYDGQPPRRLSLPTYPFRRQRYWFEMDHDSALETPSATRPAKIQLKPLVLKSRSPEEPLSPANMTPVSKPSLVAVEVGSKAEVVTRAVTIPSGLEAELQESLATVLMMAPEEISPLKPFVDLGLDSIVGVEWVKAINEHYGLQLNATEIYDSVNLRQFTAFVAGRIQGDCPAAVEVAEVVEPDKMDTLLSPLRELLAEALLMSPDEIPFEKPFVDLGLDSIVGVEWIKAVNHRFGLNLTTENLYQYDSLSRFADFVARQIESGSQSESEKFRHSMIEPSVTAAEEPEEPIPDGPTIQTTDIAIVGMSGRFPGAETAEQLWQLLSEGRDAFGELPIDRQWSVSEESFLPRKGGFLSPIDGFDPLFFQISPKEAASMDPTERIFLQESWKAIEDAGIDPLTLSGRCWGVFCGNGGDYSLHLKDVLGYAPHVTLSHVPARVSYCLNLNGPCASVDVGCGSALMAMAQACDQLLAGKCESSIAGGAFIHSTPNLLLSATQIGLLNQDGQARALDVTASGMVPAEAVGVVVLKRLEDALQAGDRIHGVIKGWGYNHNGKTQGVVSPSEQAQRLLLSQVHQRYGIHTQDISLAEAHAAGMPGADEVELKALSQVFGSGNGKHQYCALGTVENNIGHAFHSAGMGHVFKVLLAMRHGQIPATINVQQPATDLQHTPFYINNKSIPWQTPAGKPRIAALNSFGATGVNVHMVIAEPPQALMSAEPISDDPQQPALLVLSAKTAAALTRRCEQLLAGLKGGDYSYRQLAANLLLRRSHFEYRCALVVTDIDSLKHQLAQIIAGEQPDCGCTGRVEQEQPVTQTLGSAYQQIARDKIETLKTAGDAQLDDFLVLADLYVKGVPLDLSDCFSTAEQRPLSLPGYPFENRRCWMDKNMSAQTAAILDQADDEINGAETANDTVTVLTNIIAEITDLAEEEINAESDLSEYGIDSLLSLRILNRLQAVYQHDFPATLLHGKSLLEVAREIDSIGVRIGTEFIPVATNDGRWITPPGITQIRLPFSEAEPAVVSAEADSLLQTWIAQGVGIWKTEHELVFECDGDNDVRLDILSQSSARLNQLAACLAIGQRYFPVSAMQRFFLEQSHIHHNTGFHIGQIFQFDGPVDLPLLNQALNDMVQQHSILRTCAGRCGDLWVQVVHDEWSVCCREVCWPEINQPEEFLQQLQAFQNQCSTEPFDELDRPLFNACVLHNRGSLCAAYLHMHHFHADGFTLYLLQQEWYERYQALLEKRTYPAPEKNAEYMHFTLSQWNQKWRQGTQWWMKQWQNSTPLWLREKPEWQDSSDARTGMIEVPVSASLLAQLEQYNRSHHTTLTQLISCALVVILHRLGHSCPVMQMVYNLRDRYEYESVMGDFASSLPLGVRVTADDCLSDVCASYQQAMQQLQQHRHVDFHALNEHVHGQMLSSGISIDSNDTDTFGGVTEFARRILPTEKLAREPVAPLLICILKSLGELSIPVIYDQSRFSEVTVQLLSNSVVSVLEQMVANPDTRVTAVQLPPALFERLEWVHQDSCIEPQMQETENTF
ncbi:SDR family NAD(P)-dependent oxidoreductase [Gynuella sunshinyii]|uniref:PKS n=1 Tax=Gynuella sunshinyii YC6258 TaxID=1445510 RepID=A0A0C5VK82_9GAMM|nr:SDR family NAD(P)-dependent oxidoreductase [Gynuella sunshinyii]AJQ95102.1 polyketide synthase modules-related protein [Gynuella sunshinyii YC6258]DAC80077.1 TPA_exp: PKS [Gynuella sunshinyii YC6258]